MGDDVFNYFHTWKNVDDIQKKIKLVVFKRDNQINESNIKKYNPILIDNEICLESSTAIRKGEFDQVPRLAQEYIAKKFLYVEELVEKNQSEKRWYHTLTVAKWAKIISEGNKEDTKKAYYAALFHDLTKEWSEERQKNIIKKIFIN